MITIPTISQIYTTLKNDVESNLQITINLIGKVFLRAYTLAYAGKLKLLYLVLGQIQKNIAPDICDEETLLRYGKLKLNRLPYSAIQGQYQVSVIGTIGAVIPALTVFKSDDDALNSGILYQLDTQYTLVTSIDYITLRCLTGGQAGKLAINDTLTSTTPLTLVSSIATVVAETVQPIEAESTADYRNKVVLAFRLEPKGGSDADYILWSLDAEGVANAFPYAKSGESSAVIVYIEANKIDSTDGKGTPTSLIISDVESVINFSPDTSLTLYERGRRPTDVRLYVEAITPKDIIITVPNFAGLTTQKAIDIRNALEAYLEGVRPFIAGADVLTNKNDTIDLNSIIQTISNTYPGSSYGTVSFTVDGVSETSFIFTLGNIPYLSSLNIT